MQLVFKISLSTKCPRNLSISVKMCENCPFVQPRSHQSQDVATASLRRWLQCVYLGRALWICDGWRGEGGWRVHGSGVVSPAPLRGNTLQVSAEASRAGLPCLSLHHTALFFIVLMLYILFVTVSAALPVALFRVRRNSLKRKRRGEEGQCLQHLVVQLVSHCVTICCNTRQRYYYILSASISCGCFRRFLFWPSTLIHRWFLFMFLFWK